MKKVLNISKVLVFYDCPEVFIAKDNVETNYLCLLVDLDEFKATHIAIAISPPRLTKFLRGGLDLRSLFLKPESNEWLVFNDYQETVEAVTWEGESLPEDYLPEEGFFLEDTYEQENQIKSEVNEKRNAVVHLAISDLKGSNSVDIVRLSTIVKLYQQIIEYSYKKSLKNRNIQEQKTFSVPANYKLRAFDSSYGSFNLHLYSTSQADLFGDRMISLGLEKFDEITRDFDNDDEFITSLKSVQGHAISSLRKLVQTIIKDDIQITHQWFAPNRSKVSVTRIDRYKAEKISHILNLSEELAEEKREFKGYFEQVDVEKGTWRIFNHEDKKKYSGTGKKTDLAGVIVSTVVYKLICREVIEEMRVSEKEKVSYQLEYAEEVKSLM